MNAQAVCPRASLGVLIVSLVVGHATNAQAQPRVGRSLKVSAGLGITFLDDASQANDSDVDARGKGFYGETEYSTTRTNWFGPRVYGGVLLTAPDDTCEALRQTCKVSAKIGFLGAKVRWAIPIPNVAPFFELGAGTSFGVMSTKTLVLDKRMNGVTYHIPISVGVAFGRSHEYEFAFAFLEHPTMKQVAGALAVSLDFPLH